MKANAFILVLNFGLFFTQKSNAQNYTTESKSCGSYKKSVTIKSKIGNYCPHCHVRCGYENEIRTNPNSVGNRIGSYDSYPKTQNWYAPLNSPFIYEPSNVIKNTSLRSSPGTENSILGTIPRNSDVIITKYLGDWAKTSCVGKFIGDESLFFESYTGWVHRSNSVE